MEKMCLSLQFLTWAKVMSSATTEWNGCSILMETKNVFEKCYLIASMLSKGFHALYFMVITVVSHFKDKSGFFSTLNEMILNGI